MTRRIKCIFAFLYPKKYIMNTKPYFLYLIAIFLFQIQYLCAQKEPFVRFPAINPAGNMLSFSYQGDIWTVPIVGGKATRLTIHEGYESKPRWSFDGNQIAFQGNRFGNYDIYLVNKDGNSLKRLTHHSSSDVDPSWSPNNDIVFSTRRSYVQLERESEIYQLSPSESTPVRIMNGLGSGAVVSPDGSMIALMMGSCRITREAYNGPANRNIWVYHKANDTYHQITNFEGQDIYPRWGKDGDLYFLSTKNQKYNLYKVSIQSDGSLKPKSEKRLTNFKDDGIRYYDINSSGTVGVIERQNRIFKINLTSKKLTPISIKIPIDDRFDSYENKTFNSGLSDYSISPNGKFLALEIRGEIFVKQLHKEKARSINISNHPFNDHEPQWLNDTTILFISDRSGSYDIYQVQSNDPDESNIFKSLKHKVTRLMNTGEEETRLSVSPDYQKLAVARNRGQLLVYDIDSTGGLIDPITLLDGWSTPSGLAWSPDSKWLAYSLSDLDFNSEIYIHAADNKQGPVNVSMHPRGDYNPYWSADGSKLGFLSIRNNGDADVWFAWLNQIDWEKTKPDWEEEEESDKPRSGKDKPKETEVIIDFENIHQRLVQVTAFAGNESNLIINKKGDTFIFTTNGSGRQGSGGTPELKSIKWDGSGLKTILPNARIGNLSMGPKRDYLYYNSFNGGLNRLKGASGKPERLPYQAKMRIDHREERKQVFTDAWKTLNFGFYDPDFHGRDWTTLKQKYEPWARAASTKQDFMDMFNEMLGQVDASHMGMSGPTPEETQIERTGYLGVEVEPIANGVKIINIIPGSPGDKQNSKLKVGEIITAVNESPVSRQVNYFSLLNQKANDKILLSVTGLDGESREVVIRPASSVRREQYESWVKTQKELTDRYSNGRLGYIHIQGMNWPSFERFERELMASGNGKEGIVIDVRFNGGGWTTDMLMAVLNVRQHAYTVPRGAAKNLSKEHLMFKSNYPFGERLPLASWTKPSIALCNQNSYSNAEIFSHAYKHLGHGTLVGTPTFGAVISTGGARLMDGTFVRLPFRAWYVYHTEKNMEHGPAVPDIIVENPPDIKAKGEDLQLKKAVETLLQEIKMDK